MPGVFQVHIGDQRARRDDPTLPQEGWLDGDLFAVYDEYTALLEAANELIASPQNPDRGAAFDYPQYATLRAEWFAIRRSVGKFGGIGRNTLTPTSAQIEDLFVSWTNKTSGNAPDQQITRAKYATYDPDLRNRSRTKYLWITLNRDLTREEVNTWTGKHRAAVVVDEPEPEHSPRWIDYEADLVVPGHVTQRARKQDTPALATKADVRATNRIIDVTPGRPDTIVRVRSRLLNGDVAPGNRIDETPVLRGRR